MMMTNTKRNWLVGGAVTGIIALASLIGLWPDSMPPAPPKPPITVMPVQMPPAPPEPSPEQLAAAEESAEQARLAEAKSIADAKAKADAKTLAAKTPATKAKPAQITKKKVTISKGQRSVTQVVVQPAEEAAKPKEVRFNMSQDGKKMTAEDFDAWMKAQGIRIVPAKPAASPSPSAAEPAKSDEK